ncbi:hypothetical protein MLD38_037319 [Melastoma candidum]|uniref:Uncharacterized protein n=1 Tax=Melastoma candidum TaxID=119954 RepID=A0ACB9LLQ9_9MYRT|nr:hypothetical protein MLD38_037319 [Melastoma candidum]
MARITADLSQGFQAIRSKENVARVSTLGSSGAHVIEGAEAEPLGHFDNETASSKIRSTASPTSTPRACLVNATTVGTSSSTISRTSAAPAPSSPTTLTFPLGVSTSNLILVSLANFASIFGNYIVLREPIRVTAAITVLHSGTPSRSGFTHNGTASSIPVKANPRLDSTLTASPPYHLPAALGQPITAALGKIVRTAVLQPHDRIVGLDLPSSDSLVDSDPWPTVPW